MCESTHSCTPSFHVIYSLCLQFASNKDAPSQTDVACNKCFDFAMFLSIGCEFFFEKIRTNSVDVWTMIGTDPKLISLDISLWTSISFFSVYESHDLDNINFNLKQCDSMINWGLCQAHNLDR